MKKLLVALLITVVVTSATAQNLPFSFDQVIAWDSVPAAMRAKLLAYANAGSYNETVNLTASKISKAVKVTGVKSRSGNVEDQVWLEVKSPSGEEKNYLLSLSDVKTKFPSYKKSGEVITVGSHRGDSDPDPE